MKNYFLIIFLCFTLFSYSQEEDWGTSFSYDSAKVVARINKQKDSLSLLNIVNKIVSSNSYDEIDVQVSHEFNFRRDCENVFKYSEVLIPKLYPHYKKTFRIAKLLAVLDLPQNLKDSMLNDNRLDDLVKARLGDVKSEQTYVNNYYQTLKIKFDASQEIECLIYINSNRTKQIIFEAMESKKILLTTCYGGAEESKITLAAQAIFIYGRSHKDEPVFILDYYNRYTNVLNVSEFGVQHKELCKKLEETINRLEHKTIKINIPFFILGYCDGSIW